MRRRSAARTSCSLADVREDERFAGGPEDPRNIRFFAGAPIITARAGAIGTISVMDIAVRELDAEQLASLEELAREAGRQFDIRLGANEVLARVAPEEPARRRRRPSRSSAASSSSSRSART